MPAITARQLWDHLRAENLAIAHAAPWLQDAGDVDERTFPIFATRQDQIVHALKSLSNMGVRDLGAIYATPQDYALQHDGVERTAAALQLRLQSFRNTGDARDLGQRLNSGTPAILLFVGGNDQATPVEDFRDPDANGGRPQHPGDRHPAGAHGHRQPAGGAGLPRRARPPV